MAALDASNGRFGRGAVVPASAGFAPRRDWSTKFEMRSPRYTTRLDELPVIAAALDRAVPSRPRRRTCTVLNACATCSAE
ncbi:hypothetical protein BGCPKDLD_1520 [Methylorubrum suomiense]|uniref:DUF4113 domain-containing protein n=1 Tax=Methylorubrum suomiense TaxID=144191 RepID=A0ABQ4US05_9HYPH|nr:hypothetical protein BGCPKDLD_1520 [Methylorubrum suomiense]